MIAVLWEYNVKPDKVDDFLSFYGPVGAWVGLFSKSSGFIRTELLRDVDNPLRFVTIDYWISESHREQFLVRFKNEYDRLDNLCGTFTDHEAYLGLSTRHD